MKNSQVNAAADANAQRWRNAISRRNQKRSSTNGYYLYGEAVSNTSEGATPLPTVNVATSNAATAGHNYRAHLYGAVYEAISSMRALEVGEPLHVSAQAAEAASTMLSRLAIEGVEPPRVYTHDEEEVIFTWNYPDFKRYLTVFTDDVALLDIGTSKAVKCTYNNLPPVEEGWHAWAKALGGTASSHGSLDGDDT